MKIDSPNIIDTLINNKNLLNTKNSSNDNNLLVEDIKLPELENIITVDIFEKANLKDKLKVYNPIVIRKTNEESKVIYSQIKVKIEDLFTEQIKALELVKKLDPSSIDENTINSIKVPENEKVIEGEEKLFKIGTHIKDIDHIVEGQVLKEGISKMDFVKVNLLNRDDYPTDKSEIVQDDLLKNKLSIHKDNTLNKSILDIESSSDEIVGFIKNISDQGKGKLYILTRKVVDIFNDLEKAMGTLPDISNKTYSRIIEKLDNLISIEKFINKPESIKMELRRIVENTIIEQNRTFKIFKETEIIKNGNSIVKNEIIVENNRALLLLQGQLSIKESSERILYFVREASNGDKDKLENFAREIDKIFKSLEKNLDELPKISKSTYKSVMKGLYEDEELDEILNLYSGLFSQFINIFKSGGKNIKFKDWGIKEYLPFVFLSIILYYIIKIASIK